MKFNKQLKAERIDEWKGNYFDYQHGKKLIYRIQDAGATAQSAPFREAEKFMETELIKIKEFYAKEEQIMMDRRQALRAQFEYRDILLAPHHTREEQGIAGLTQDDYDRPQPPPKEAKKQLREALAEYYRSLELLHSYATLNTVAFRKFDKKLDKVSRNPQKLSFYNKYVQKANFHNGESTDRMLKEATEVFAQRFEGDDYKAAIGELRAQSTLDWPYLASVSGLNGTILGVSTMFMVWSIVEASKGLQSTDDKIVETTKLLVQIFAGFFMMVLLALLFCFDCHIFDSKHINYKWIFELHPGNSLNWRELVVIPLTLYSLLGITMISSLYGIDTSNPNQRVWGPLIWACLSCGLILTPKIPIFYKSSRMWFAKHLFNLLISPTMFPKVSFPDFFIGDMLCSLTFTMSSLDLLGCLTVRHWNHPEFCKSQRNVLWMVFPAIPSILRAFQCIRRYCSTRKWFPHLANFIKYCAGVAAAVCTARYRTAASAESLATLIVFCTINSILTSIWDVRMDWGLGARAGRFIKHDTALSKQHWIYYTAIILDVAGRFGWVVYVGVEGRPSYALAASFSVAIVEVLRRGMWVLLRVEHEHLNNVRAGRAYAVPALPYTIGQPSERRSSQSVQLEDYTRTEQAEHDSSDDEEEED